MRRVALETAVPQFDAEHETLLDVVRDRGLDVVKAAGGELMICHPVRFDVLPRRAIGVDAVLVLAAALRVGLWVSPQVVAKERSD